MIDFNDLGFEYTDPDGKRQFDAEQVSINDIINKKIFVLDFESGIKTKYSKEGEEKYVVLVEFENEDRRKFFTSSKKLIQVLNFAKEQNKLPFTAIIKTERHTKNHSFGYKFCSANDD